MAMKRYKKTTCPSGQDEQAVGGTRFIGWRAYKRVYALILTYIALDEWQVSK